MQTPPIAPAAPPSVELQYPGVNLPLHHLKQGGQFWGATVGVDYYRVGSCEGVNDAESELLQVREVTMMILMDRLTDKPNWHDKVFDDAIVAKWRQEALSQDEKPMHQTILGDKELSLPERTRLMTAEAFDYVR